MGPFRPDARVFRSEVTFGSLPPPDWQSLVYATGPERVNPPGRNVLGAFRDLGDARDFPAAVLAFASRHGWLGHSLPIDPLGVQHAEPVALWRREVAAVADLLDVLKHARCLRETESEIDRRWLLDRAIVLDDVDVASSAMLAFGRSAEAVNMSGRVSVLEDYSRPRGIFPVGRSASHDNRRLATVALHAVALEVESRLEGAMSVSVVAAERRRGELRFVPTTLLGHIYLQLALLVGGPDEPRLMPLCVDCKRPLRSGRTSRAQYCEDTDACRARAYRRRRRAAISRPTA